MSPYPQRPTFPVDLRGRRGVKVSRVGGTALQLEIEDSSLDNAALVAAPALSLKGNLGSELAQPQDVSLALLAEPGNPLGDKIAEAATTVSSVTPDLGDLTLTIQEMLSRQIDVRNYGTVTIGKTATPAQIIETTRSIQRAFDVAVAFKLKKVILPAGDVVIGGTLGGYGTALHLGVEAQDLIIQGNSTTIWLAGKAVTNDGTLDDYCGFLWFDRCRGRCGFAGEITVEQLNPSICQGDVAAAVAGQYIDIDLDWDPSWTTVNTISLWNVLEGVQGLVYLREAAPIEKLTGFARRYRVRLDIANVQIANLSFSGIASIVGQRVTLQHRQFGRDCIIALDCDTIVLPEGLTIRSSQGSAVYAVRARILWDGKVEAGFYNGIKRQMGISSDALHFINCAGSEVGGSVFDTGDDAVNFAGSIIPVLSRDGAQQLTLQFLAPHEALPRHGELIEVVNANYQRVYFGSAFNPVVNEGAGTYAIAVNGTLPAFANGPWYVLPRGGNVEFKVKSGFRCGRTRAAGLRLSTTRAVIGDISVINTLYEAVVGGSYFGLEYAVYEDVVIGEIDGFNIGMSRDPARPALAVIGFDPAKPDGSHVAKGAAGNLTIKGAYIRNANCRALYASGFLKLTVGKIVAENINRFSVARDGLPAGDFAQFVNCEEVETRDFSPFGTAPGFVNLQALTRLSGRGWRNLISPSGGATVIDVVAIDEFLAGWSAYAVTVRAGAGTIAAPTSALGFWRRVGKTIQWRAYVTLAGLGSGTGQFVVSVPAPIKGFAEAAGKEFAQSAYGLHAVGLDGGVELAFTTAANTINGGSPLVANGQYIVGGTYETA